MRKILLYPLTIACFLIALNSKAQISYTSTDYMSINDSLLYSETNLGLLGLDFDTTGMNITWDYSTLAYERQSISTYFDPNNSGYKNTWCALNGFIFNCNSNFQNLTNLATNNLDSVNLGQVTVEDIVSHEFNTGSALENKMTGMTARIQGVPLRFTFNYENVDSIYQFPIQFGTSDSSTSRIVFDLSPTPVVQSRNSKRVNTVEGWGSLTTPYGAFANVLKMKTVIERMDTLFLDTVEIPMAFTTLEYKWWDANYGLPVLTATGNQVGSVTTITSVRYIDSARCVAPNAFFSYAPLVPQIDTATLTATVNFNNLTNPVDSVFWNFGDGNTSTSIDPSHVYTSSGNFSVTLIAYYSCQNQLFTDTISLPLFVGDTSNVLSILPYVVDSYTDSEKAHFEYSIYPNPATTSIQVHHQDGATFQIEIFDLSGKPVLQSKEKTINIERLEKAIYIFRVIDQDGVVHQSTFIKK